eukprot:PLAT8798.1.p3 GENE.PLAT8798.1~~PLAT8798.1.p3  ORF type:complete len:205 (+),score=96.82 PLAT8798.1:46-660(+)
MSIMEYNGSAIVAMAGKNCVGIASDTRLGAQALTVGKDMQKIFTMGDRLFLGLSGLATDVQTLSQLFRFRMKLYSMTEEREIKPSTFAGLVSSTMYERRFAPWFVEPIVAGLQPDGKPFLCGMDLIGAPVYTDDFVVAGTADEGLFGLAESLYRPDLEPDELFETLAQTLLAAVDRNALSGWGGVVHIATADSVITRRIKMRQD